MNSSYDVISTGSDDANKPPIIFLHALGDWKKGWKKVAPVIVRKTRRKGYALDARNHGDSPRSKEMNIDILTQDVKEFLDMLNIQTAIIIGHSIGGRTAINFTLKYPHRVEALVIEDMTPRNINSSRQKVIPSLGEFLELFLQTLPPEMDLETGRQCVIDTILTFLGKKFINGDKIKENYDVDMMPVTKDGENFVSVCDIKVAISLLESNSFQQNLPDTNLVFEGDTLFLYGTKSFFNLEKDSSVRKLFPRALLKKIDGGSHFLHYEYPDNFAEIVSHFLIHRNLQPSKY